jgi:hypothetical protein
MIEDFFTAITNLCLSSGKAGTLIISNQQLAHKGWQKHDKKKRYALICFLIAEKYYDGQPFNLGRSAI